MGADFIQLSNFFLKKIPFPNLFLYNKINFYNLMGENKCINI
jgi:hypothetical protein